MEFNSMEKILESKGINNVTKISKLLGITRQNYYKQKKDNLSLNEKQLERFNYFLENDKYAQQYELGVDAILKVSIEQLTKAEKINNLIENECEVDYKIVVYDIVLNLLTDEKKIYRTLLFEISKFIESLKSERNIYYKYFMTYASKNNLETKYNQFIINDNKSIEEQKKYESLFFEVLEEKSYNYDYEKSFEKFQNYIISRNEKRENLVKNIRGLLETINDDKNNPMKDINNMSPELREKIEKVFKEYNET